MKPADKNFRPFPMVVFELKKGLLIIVIIQREYIFLLEARMAFYIDTVCSHYNDTRYNFILIIMTNLSCTK